MRKETYFIGFIILIIVFSGCGLETAGKAIEVDDEPSKNVGAVNKNTIPGNAPQPDYRGYIIQFKDEPVLSERTNKLKSMKKDEVKLNSQEEEDLNSHILNYKSNLKAKNKKIKYKIKEKLNKNLVKGAVTAQSQTTEIQVLNEFTNVFNGITLDISDIEAQKLKQIEEVKEVYPNTLVKATLMDSVPLINADDVWELDKNGDYCSIGGSDDYLGNEESCLTGKGVTIAIIDTGIDYTHADLGGCFGASCKVVGGYDFVNDDADPMDDNGHGTHVAGTAAGNGVLKGVAPDAKIFAYKVLDSGGSGSFSWVIAGIERAVDPNDDGDFSDHVDVISMSLGGPGNPDDPQSQAIDVAVDNGVIAVIAAGNDGPYYQTIGSPGTARKAITVGATDKTDVIAQFSSKGPVIWQNEAGKVESIIKPDILAPGVNICSAQWENAWQSSECIDTEHTAISGTSMATPHVAGAAALLKQARPDWGPEEIKTAFKNNAVDLSYAPLTQGHGRIKVLDSVLSSLSIVTPPKVTLSSVIQDALELNIIGRIDIGNFSSYSLSYTSGDTFMEDNWSLIDSPNNVGSGEVLATLRLKSVADDAYYLRLTSVKDKSTYKDYAFFILKKFEPIDFPNHVSFKNDVEVGFINNYNLTIDDFILEYSFENGTWSDIGISTEIIGNELRGVLAGGTIGNAGFLRFRATIYHDGVVEQKFLENIYLDKLTSGFPITTEPIWTSPTLYDINNDGKDEIIVLNARSNYAWGTPPFTYDMLEVYTFDGGQPYLLWEREMLNNVFPTTPIVVDWDGDGDMEIIAGASAWHHDGSVVNGFPISEEIIGSWILKNAYVEDINNDGKNELLLKTRDEGIVIFDNDLNQLFVIEYPLPGEYEGFYGSSGLMAVDMNSDGEKEIFHLGHFRDGDVQDYYLYGYTNEGALLSGWPVGLHEVYEYNLNTPGDIIAGDVDNDDNMEIVIAHSGCSLLVFNVSGFEGTIQSCPSGGSGNEAIAFAQMDDNPKLDIARGVKRFSRIVLNSETQIELKTDRCGNQFIPPQGTYSEWLENGVSIADVDGSGDQEVLISNYCGMVYVFKDDGTNMDGFPKLISGNSYGTPAVGDIDGDGKLEMVVTSYSGVEGYIYAWDLSGDVDANLEWPMFMHDPQHSGCYNCDHVEITCEDEDNDGYCIWDIGEDKPSTCPESCQPEKDCDDSNPSLGPIDENNNCQIIEPIEVKSLDFNCDSSISMDDINIVSEFWKTGVVIDIKLVTGEGKKCKKFGQYLGDLWREGISEMPISEVTRIGKEVQVHISTYDFNCDGSVSMADAEIISDLWKTGTVIDINLVTAKGVECKLLGEYLAGFWKQGISEIPISEVTRIGKEIKSLI